MNKHNFGSHAQTAHVWAQQSTNESGYFPEGWASDKRMFFNRGIIYSYGRHFPIAAHVKDLKGNAAVLFTTASYSVSTSKHIGLVRQALRGDYKVFYVPLVDGSEAENIRRMDTGIQNAIAEYGKPRIRQTTRDGIAARIADMIARRNDYGVSFIKKYKPLPIPDNIAALADKMQKDKAAQEKREAKVKAVAFENALKEAEKETGRPRTHWAQDWRDAKKDYSGLAYNMRQLMQKYVMANTGVLLRVKDKNIETSMGAEFPVTHAKKAFTFIRSVRYTKTPWEKNGKTIHLGAFQIDSIDEHGNVKAGCHTVQWGEIELIAEALGLSV